ncbi:MAG: M15 family metallopeptidase, partial [Nanoarchaeota archaeon]
MPKVSNNIHSYQLYNGIFAVTSSISKRQSYVDAPYPSFTPIDTPTFTSEKDTKQFWITSYYIPDCGSYGGSLTDEFKKKVSIEGTGTCEGKCYSYDSSTKDLKESSCPAKSVALGVNLKVKGSIATNTNENTACYIPRGAYVYIKFKDSYYSSNTGWYMALDSGGQRFKTPCWIDVYTGLESEKVSISSDYVDVWVYPIISGKPQCSSSTNAITGELYCPPIQREFGGRSFDAYNQIYGKVVGTGSSATNLEVQQNSKSIQFMGQTVKVHSKLDNVYKCVEQEIKKCSENYPLDSSKRIDGLRTGNSVSTISRHMYGIAFDYNKNDNPYCTQSVLSGCSSGSSSGLCCNPNPRNRYKIPQCYIDSFRKFGFTWGGEW